MVHSGPASVTHRDITFGGRRCSGLEQWRVDNPAERPGIRVDQIATATDLDARRTEQLLRGLPLAGSEEDGIARFGVCGRDDSGLLCVREVLGDRTGQFTGLVDRDVSQTASTTLLGPLLPGIELAARQRSPPGHHDAAHVRSLEDPERGLREDRRDLVDHQVEPQIGLVRAEVVHRLVPAEALHRTRQFDVYELPDLRHDLFGHRDDIVLINEAHLDIELGELRLPIGPEVLVPVAAGDLVVVLHTSDHQQLLEQLGALRQRIPRTRTQSRRHQEVPGAFGSRSGQGRGLNIHESERVKGLADRVSDSRAQSDGLGLTRTAQIKVAVLEPRVLADIDTLVDRERQRCGRVEYLKPADHDLDLAGGHGRVHGIGRAGLDHARNRNAELVAQPVGTELVH